MQFTNAKLRAIGLLQVWEWYDGVNHWVVKRPDGTDLKIPGKTDTTEADRMLEVWLTDKELAILGIME